MDSIPFIITSSVHAQDFGPLSINPEIPVPSIEEDLAGSINLFRENHNVQL